MVIERKIIVGLEDLQSVIFECTNQEKKCTSRVCVSPDEGKIPAKCPNCDVEWIHYPLRDLFVSGSTLSQLVRLLADARKRQSETTELLTAMPNFRILLEFDEPIAT
jgi:hypothetical protein